MITPPARRRPGRPPLDPGDRAVGVFVRFPSRRYDELYTRARAARVSIPELIRQALTPAPPPKR